DDHSDSSDTTAVNVAVDDPASGDYVIRMVNYAAQPTVEAAPTFTPPTAPELTAKAESSFADIGFCGYIHTIPHRTTLKIGVGHVFKSTDAVEHFTDISGNLPDTPAEWTVVHNNHVVVGPDIGVFESTNTSGGTYRILGAGPPNVQISTLLFRPGHPDELI